MQAIELEATITQNHQIHLSIPDYITAKKAKVIVMFEEKNEKRLDKKMNLMKYSGTIAWKEDGMSYQDAIRAEWDGR